MAIFDYMRGNSLPTQSSKTISKTTPDVAEKWLMSMRLFNMHQKSSLVSSSSSQPVASISKVMKSAQKKYLTISSQWWKLFRTHWEDFSYDTTSLKCAKIDFQTQEASMRLKEEESKKPSKPYISTLNSPPISGWESEEDVTKQNAKKKKMI